MYCIPCKVTVSNNQKSLIQHIPRCVCTYTSNARYQSSSNKYNTFAGSLCYHIYCIIYSDRVMPVPYKYIFRKKPGLNNPRPIYTVSSHSFLVLSSELRDLLGHPSCECW